MFAGQDPELEAEILEGIGSSVAAVPRYLGQAASSFYSGGYALFAAIEGRARTATHRLFVRRQMEGNAPTLQRRRLSRDLAVVATLPAPDPSPSFNLEQTESEKAAALRILAPPPTLTPPQEPDLISLPDYPLATPKQSEFGPMPADSPVVPPPTPLSQALINEAAPGSEASALPAAVQLDAVPPPPPPGYVEPGAPPAGGPPPPPPPPAPGGVLVMKRQLAPSKLIFDAIAAYWRRAREQEAPPAPPPGEPAAGPGRARFGPVTVFIAQSNHSNYARLQEKSDVPERVRRDELATLWNTLSLADVEGQTELEARLERLAEEFRRDDARIGTHGNYIELPAAVNDPRVWPAHMGTVLDIFRSIFVSRRTCDDSLRKFLNQPIIEAPARQVKQFLAGLKESQECLERLGAAINQLTRSLTIPSSSLRLPLAEFASYDAYLDDLAQLSSADPQLMQRITNLKLFFAEADGKVLDRNMEHATKYVVVLAAPAKQTLVEALTRDFRVADIRAESFCAEQENKLRTIQTLFANDVIDKFQRLITYTRSQLASAIEQERGSGVRPGPRSTKLFKTLARLLRLHDVFEAGTPGKLTEENPDNHSIRKLFKETYAALLLRQPNFVEDHFSMLREPSVLEMIRPHRIKFLQSQLDQSLPVSAQDALTEYYEPLLHSLHCASCGVAVTSGCPACRDEHYCSEDCMEAHAEEHAQICGLIGEHNKLHRLRVKFRSAGQVRVKHQPVDAKLKGRRRHAWFYAYQFPALGFVQQQDNAYIFHLGTFTVPAQLDVRLLYLRVTVGFLSTVSAVGEADFGLLLDGKLIENAAKYYQETRRENPVLKGRSFVVPDGCEIVPTNRKGHVELRGRCLDWQLAPGQTHDLRLRLPVELHPVGSITKELTASIEFVLAN